MQRAHYRLQTIFGKWDSSGHLYLKWTCMHLDTTRWLTVNGSQKESTTCVWCLNLWVLTVCLLNASIGYLGMAQTFLYDSSIERALILWGLCILNHIYLSKTDKRTKFVNSNSNLTLQVWILLLQFKPKMADRAHGVIWVEQVGNRALSPSFSLSRSAIFHFLQ